VIASGLGQLQRKRRQLDTLKLMLRDVEEVLDLARDLANDRELTSDEQNEVANLNTRRERLISSITEAGG
jgi:hypothetical protein